MAIEEFPPHDTADSDGLLAIGGDLEVESLLLAYQNGIFPWPFDDEILAWFSPPKRAVLFLDRFHVSTSLAREMRRTNYTYSMNTAFEAVMEHCSELTNRKNQRGTWITPAMKKAYLDLHHAGFAYSFECRNNDQLIGGVYGVAIKRMITAESMFYHQPNASKLTLHYMVEHFKSEKIEWIDCQVLNPFTKSLGAREIPREMFLELVGKGLM